MQTNGAAPHEPKINVTLAQSQWQILLNVLAEQPYRISASLIAEIQAQAQASLAAHSPSIPTHTLTNKDM